MAPKLDFTDEETVKMWRFAMEEHPDRGRMNMWGLFIEKTESNRNPHSLYHRFNLRLLPQLPKTQFHTETKLKLCKKYEVKVTDEFLKELEKHAKVQLDDDGIVKSYQLKPNCEKNRDMEMDDEEFMRIMTPSAVELQGEDAEIWKYVFENSEKYAPENEFWQELAAKLGGNRTVSGFREKFRKGLAPNLHKTNFSIEKKLLLFKRCQIPVDKKYLKTLKEHAELELDTDGRITRYRLRSSKEKRKNEKAVDGRAKKSKTDAGSSSAILEERDLIIDDIVPGAGTLNPVITRPPKIEINDDENELTVDQQHRVFDFNLKAEEMDYENLGAIHDEENFDNAQFEERRSENPSDSTAKILEIVQRMETSHKEDMLEIKKAQQQVTVLTETVASMRDELQTIRNMIVQGPEDATASSRKKYLLNLKKFVSSLKSPETTAVVQRIDDVLQNLPENDEDTLAMKPLSAILAVLIDC